MRDQVRRSEAMDPAQQFEAMRGRLAAHAARQRAIQARVIGAALLAGLAGGVALLVWPGLVPGSPRVAAPAAGSPDPTAGAAAAALAEIRASFRAEHSVVPGSVVVLGNAEARGLRSVALAGRPVAIERAHLLPPDPNRVAVAGVLEVEGGASPFVAYLLFDPATGRYRRLDLDVLSP